MARQVAHEIKNPLTPVQLSAEHLLRINKDKDKPLSPVLESCVESILKQVRILRQISAEFSNYASAPVVHRKPITLAALVNDVLSSYLIGLESRIKVTVAIPNSIPPLLLDQRLVSSALTNVVENALYAMPENGSLEIRASQRKDAVVMTVKDTGIGLDKETLQRIFEPYFSTKAFGTGLGMAIAKRNLELNDALIEVKSEKGLGTTVSLTFLSSSIPT